MKVFKNADANVLEYVTNEELLEQYEARPEKYELVQEEKEDKKTKK